MRNLLLIMAAIALSVVPVGAVRAQLAMDVAALIGVLNVGDTTNLLAGVHAANNVHMARVTTLAGIRPYGDFLSKAVERRGRVIRELRHGMRSIKAVQRALEIHNQTLDQVIWVTVTNDRVATLYVDNR
jgi:hypothetical protein